MVDVRTPEIEQVVADDHCTVDVSEARLAKTVHDLPEEKAKSTVGMIHGDTMK